VTALYGSDVDGEGFTELVDGDFPRVDLVGRAANGVPRFLIAKSAAGGSRGLMEAAVVRGLVEKAEQDTAQMTEADLRRQVASGTAEQKRAALLELGTRVAHGLQEPPPGQGTAEDAAFRDLLQRSNAASEPDRPTTLAEVDLTPAPSGEVGTPAHVVAKAVAVGMAAERAVEAGTMTTAGAALVRERANTDAARQIAALRASGRSGVVRKEGVPVRTIGDVVRERRVARVNAASRRHQGKG
jgi:hypothetical protein